MRGISFLAAIVALLAAPARAQPVDLLLAADDAALRPVLARLSDAKSESRAAWTFWRGRLAGKSVALARTEGDPLNAVAATTLAIRLFQPRLIVTFGVARPHAAELRAGDIVVSEAFAAFDGMISTPTPLEGGSDALRWGTRPHPLMTAGEKETPTESFPADARARTVALALPRPDRARVVAGVLGSAHQINRESDRIAWLRERWKTSTEDGESAHVAGCALLLETRVVGFRIVDGPPDAAASFVLQFVEAWK